MDLTYSLKGRVTRRRNGLLRSRLPYIVRPRIHVVAVIDCFITR